MAAVHALQRVLFTCRSMRAYLKPAARGTLGFISSSCVISIPFFKQNFSKGAASDTVHKPASASLKSPLVPE